VPEFVKLLCGLYKKSKSYNLILLLIVYIACVYFVYLFLFIFVNDYFTVNIINIFMKLNLSIAFKLLCRTKTDTEIYRN